MAESYIETTLIECDRSSAQTKNDDNMASWTTNFNNTINMNPGDKLSVYSGFVCERGATQPNSIEYKGATLKKQKTITYTNSVTTTRNYSQPDSQIEFYEQPYTTINTETSETINLKDNEANIVISYYKTLDMLNYVQLPRRWIPDTSDTYISGDNERRAWNIEDSRATGRVNREPYDVGVDNLGATFTLNNVYGYVVDDYSPVFAPQDINGTADPRLWDTPISRWILKNDNSRYTIMRRDKVFHFPKRWNYAPKVAGAGDQDNPTLYYGGLPDAYPPGVPDANTNSQYFIPPYWQRDPEQYDYTIYKEKIKLDVDPGFSAAEFISDKITSTLRETTINPTEVLQTNIATNIDPTDPSTKLQMKLPINKTAESNTYKLFHCTNDQNFNELLYNRCINNSGRDYGEIQAGIGGPTLVTNVSGGGVQWAVNQQVDWFASPWYESLEYIAVKRPEIYEAGCKLNTIQGITISSQSTTRTKAFYEEHGFSIDYPYSELNCKFIKDFVESQTLYPELFSQENIINMYVDSGTEATNRYYSNVVTDTGDDSGAGGKTCEINNITMNATFNNARFMHMNTQTSLQLSNALFSDTTNFPFGQISTEREAPLGSSYYDWMGTDNTNKFNYPEIDGGTGLPINPSQQNPLAYKQSVPFLFYYDINQKDKFYSADVVSTENTNRISSNLNLTYGCMGRDSHNRIVLYPNLLKTSTGAGCGIPSKVYDSVGGAGNNLDRQRKLGFDRHWNAWGTCAVALTSGIASVSRFYEDNINTPENTPGSVGNAINSTPTQDPQNAPAFGKIPESDRAQINVNPLQDKVYLGAPRSQLGFDGNHFFFSNLHNDLNRGDLVNSPAGADTTVPPRIVYKINPEQTYNNYSPVQFPYEKPVTFDYIDSSLGSAQTISQTNKNIEAWSVFDTDSGIFIEDLGFDKDSWEFSLWKRLGFSYNQFNGSVDRLQRHPEQPEIITKITTNSKLDSVDTKEWNQNQFASPVFDGQLAHAYNINMAMKKSDASSELFAFRFLPRIVIATESIKVLAENYPIKSFKGYYTIRSDIVPMTNFVGGGIGNTSMPIVGVIDKMNPYGDFFTGSEPGLEFTITKPTTIASASVEITDPDGSYSVVSERCSVIFKLQRKRSINPNLTKTLVDKLKNESEKQREKDILKS